MVQQVYEAVHSCCLFSLLFKMGNFCFSIFQFTSSILYLLLSGFFNSKISVGYFFNTFIPLLWLSNFSLFHACLRLLTKAFYHGSFKIVEKS